jgi:quercetin dioxygenase-like cupin family protein
MSTEVATGKHIDNLRDAMQNAIDQGTLSKVEAPLEHYHTDDLYGRRIFVPAGATVITAVHKSEHFTVALTGHCIVVDENGERSEVVAPAVFVTKPGTQRAVHALSDTQWFTAHACKEKDLKGIEKALVCDNQQTFLLGENL